MWKAQCIMEDTRKLHGSFTRVQWFAPCNERKLSLAGNLRSDWCVIKPCLYKVFCSANTFSSLFFFSVLIVGFFFLGQHVFVLSNLSSNSGLFLYHVYVWRPQTNWSVTYTSVLIILTTRKKKSISFNFTNI